MDCRLYLRACRYHPQTASPETESLHNFTNSERHALRTSAAASAICKFRLQIIFRFQRTKLQPVNFIQRLTGQ